MSDNQKFVLKIFLIIFAMGIIIFLFQIGKYYYEIQTGKIIPQFSQVEQKNTPEVIDINEIISLSAPSYGSEQPELTIIEFGNFLCPHSTKTGIIARELMLKYKESVKFIYRDYAIDDIYENSSYWSLVGRCSDEQGKFWNFFDKNLQETKDSAVVLAIKSGVEQKQLLDCVEKQKYFEEVQNDLLQGYKNGVRGTPTFFFIKKGFEDKPIKIEGAIPRDTFEELIEKILSNS